MLTRALTALRRSAATGRGDQCVPVRRGHLRALLEAYDREVAESSGVPVARVHCLTCNADCGWAGVNREPSLSGECADYEPQETAPGDPFEVLSDACGVPMRRVP